MADKDLTPQVPGEVSDTVPEAVEAPKKAPKAAKPAPKPQADGLPDMGDVDPEKIHRAVLTRQGWVVPAAKVVA